MAKFALSPATAVLELENAKRQIDEITKAIQAFDKLSNTQNEQDKASGKAVQEELDKNGPEFAAQLKTDSAKMAIATHGPLKKAKEDQLQFEREADRYGDLAVKNPNMASHYAALSADAMKNAKKAATEATDIQSRVEENAKQDVGQMILEATTGTGAKQELGRKKLAGQLGGLGFNEAAEAVTRSANAKTPSQAKKEKEAEDEWEKDQKKIKAKEKKADKLLEDMNEQGISNQLQTFKEHADTEDKIKKEAEHKGKKNLDDFKRKADHDDKEVIKNLTENTSLNEKAAAQAAAFMNQGGMRGKNGKIIPLSEQQQREELGRQISREIRTDDPNISVKEAARIADKMAHTAQRGATEGFGAERARLVEQMNQQAQQTGQSVPEMLGVMNQTQANQLITNQALANTVSMLGKLSAQAQGIGMDARRAAGAIKQMNDAQSHANAGGPGG